jgi:glycosyltransferase involved in cell wall biosynthesis
MIPQDMKLSVIIPVYNESGTILEVINRVEDIKINKEIIVVDDCSTDGTRELLKKNAFPHTKILFHEKNTGKGAAIKTALTEAAGDVVIIQDADLEYDPNDFYELIKPIISGKAEVVYGSRFKGRKTGMYFSHMIGTKFFNFLVYLLYRQRISDESTCYKAFKTEILKNLNLRCRGFEFCPEVTAKVMKRGYKIFEVPISYSGRCFKSGKKVTWKDGFLVIWTLLKYKLYEDKVYDSNYVKN